MNGWREQHGFACLLISKKPGDASLKIDALNFQSFDPSGPVSPFDLAKAAEQTVDPAQIVANGSRCVNDQRLFLLTQQEQAERMIDIGIGKENGRETRLALGARTELRTIFKLCRQIRRCVDEIPTCRIGADHN